MEIKSEYTKWVSCWGNATSIADQEIGMFAKDITLRYPVKMCFSGNQLRMRFSNLTGTEAVTLSEVTVANAVDEKVINIESLVNLTFNNGCKSVTIQPGEEVTCDEFDYEVEEGETLTVGIYLGDYTQMNSGVLITGPLSKGFYSYGNHLRDAELPTNLTRNTNWFYFLNTIDIFTEEKNHALICYGDSITAQSWPDYLSLRVKKLGINNISIIRRAVSGTRILRQYDCITYAAYGLKGETRFPIEMNVAGADIVIIQHGINDIIHPVGTEINPFRPWEDLPTAEEMAQGVEKLYIEHARNLGYKVWGGTLLPIR